MPEVQMQIVRRYAGGAEAIVYAENVDLRDNHEYLDAERSFARRCGSTDYVRTVGSDSPKRAYVTTEDEDAEV